MFPCNDSVSVHNTFLTKTLKTKTIQNVKNIYICKCSHELNLTSVPSETESLLLLP